MPDRRRQPRFSTLGLTSPYGQVTNLSDTGLCIFRKGKLNLTLGQSLRLKVCHADAEAELAAEVVRIEPLGLFRHEVGVSFSVVDAAALGEIRRLIEVAHAESVSPTCFIAA